MVIDDWSAIWILMFRIMWTGTNQLLFRLLKIYQAEHCIGTERPHRTECQLECTRPSFFSSRPFAPTLSAHDFFENLVPPPSFTLANRQKIS